MEINIPTSLKEITLGDFQLYMESNQTDEDKLRYILKLTPNTIKAIKRRDFVELVDRIDTILNEPVEFEQFFTLAGTKYGFIPNLEDMNQAEFMDIDSNISDIQTLHTACAVLFRPIIGSVKEKYAVIDYTPSVGFDEVMKHIPLNIALGAKVFFWNLGRELAKITPVYLAQESEEMILTGGKNLTSVGGGMAV